MQSRLLFYEIGLVYNSVQFKRRRLASVQGWHPEMEDKDRNAGPPAKKIIVSTETELGILFFFTF